MGETTQSLWEVLVNDPKHIVSVFGDLTNLSCILRFRKSNSALRNNRYQFPMKGTNKELWKELLIISVI